jgi:hypothetical protein
VGWRYLVNGEPVPEGLARVPRGVVHAPPRGKANEALQPLFVLSCLPRQLEGTVTSALPPGPSLWLWSVNLVMYLQLLVLAVYCVQGWVAGTRMSQADVTLGSFVAFVVGHLVQG